MDLIRQSERARHLIASCAAAHVRTLFTMCLLGTLCGCGRDVVEPVPEPRMWDTTFQVLATEFPDDGILSRAIVEAGNNHRLADFLRKCDSGADVKIGFIGGSITGGASATSASRRYSSRLCEFLGKYFPTARIHEINAGIGATTSRFACSRMQEDLLSAKPDLIVIEFAVNDDAGDTAASAATMEGLVRQGLQHADVPVLLFQTMNMAGDSANHLSQLRVARHYGLPVIGYKQAIWPLVASGDIPWEMLSPDVVHPNDVGHLIGGYLLFAYLRGEYRLLDDGADAPLAMPGPLKTDMYQHAGFFRPGDSVLAIAEKGGWSLAADGKGRYNLVSLEQGDRLMLRSAAREVTLAYQYAKDLHAEVAVILDGGVVDTLDNHFAEDWGGGYLKNRQVYAEEASREHLVEFVNLTGGKFDLRYVMHAR